MKKEASPSSSISPAAQQHHFIREQVLMEHPSIKEWFKPEPRTAGILLVLVFLHWTIMATVCHYGIFWAPFAAFFLGQFIVHTGAALLHENTHRTIFLQRWASNSVNYGLEVLFTSFSFLLEYKSYHLSSHHRFLGDYHRDWEIADRCFMRSKKEFKRRHPILIRILTLHELLLSLFPFGHFFYNRTSGALIWLRTKLPLVDLQRNLPLPKVALKDRVLFALISLVVIILIGILFGLPGLVYQVLSFTIFVGRLGITFQGQNVCEHSNTPSHQPTYSTYGKMNYLVLNSGYHCEHHTFPEVAWIHLPKLRPILSKYFPIENKVSYGRHWLNFVFNHFIKPIEGE